MPVPLLSFLFVTACAFSVPVILVLLIGRPRLNGKLGRLLLATSFASATGYMLWRLDWFDVWRHGTPALSQVFIYASYMAAYGAIGWFIAGKIDRVRAVERPTDP